MTQHTPGPWEVWNHDNDPRHVYVGPVRGGLCVAAVVSCNAHGVYTPETEAQGRSDAQLVAAAPDLLHYLELAVNTIKGEYPESQWADYKVPEMENAIDRAKGKL